MLNYFFHFISSILTIFVSIFDDDLPENKMIDSLIVKHGSHSSNIPRTEINIEKLEDAIELDHIKFNHMDEFDMSEDDYNPYQGQTDDFEEQF